MAASAGEGGMAGAKGAAAGGVTGVVGTGGGGATGDVDVFPIVTEGTGAATAL